MELREIEKRFHAQKAYFLDGKTLPVAARKRALCKLLAEIETKEDTLIAALKQDLGKSRPEGYMCELGLVKSEIRYMLRHIDRYAREHRVRTPLAQALSRSFVKPVPYGTVLIMSPWNYPLLLALDPLVDAIAAGNTAMIKPSAYAPATADVLEKLISDSFLEEYATVIKGGREENASLLDFEFDYIFFTGSKTVGREVMQKAAKRLIPVTLELGGKSPCIVDETANIRLAAKRIVFGKFINCGQTCVAPDYIYCAENIREELLKELRYQIKKQYGEKPLQNSNYGKMINQKHFDRVCGLIEQDRVVCGGETNTAALQIAPTVMDQVTWEDPVMKEEIFGPVLPVLTYKNISEVVKKVNEMDAPLALYIFSSDRERIRFVTERIRFGGGCINDTIIHLATSAMGFGGVGASGMGAYHGKKGFDTFTHEKSIVDKKTLIDLPMRYQPYTAFYEKLVRLFLK
ncbi:MAG: aldehyde dehydrogenase [Lachnospiraceae bacterium]|nr:aldehyde dehydrogenase [Lachnospiraceae bacterium]